VLHEIDVMNWKPGDKAIIANDFKATPNDLMKFRGVSCVLVKYVGIHETTDQIIRNAWEVQTKHNTVWVEEKILRKPYDGNELTEWSKCAFQPETVTT